MFNRRNIGLALGMAAAVALTSGALIASTAKNTPPKLKQTSTQELSVSAEGADVLID